MEKSSLENHSNGATGETHWWRLKLVGVSLSCIFSKYLPSDYFLISKKIMLTKPDTPLTTQMKVTPSVSKTHRWHMSQDDAERAHHLCIIFSKVHNLNLIMENTWGKSKLKDILQNFLIYCSRVLRLWRKRKDRGLAIDQKVRRLERVNKHERWEPGLSPKTEKGISGKPIFS